MNPLLRPLCCLAIALSFVSVEARSQNVRVEHVQRLPNMNNPELMYMFVQPEQLQDHEYLKEMDSIAAHGTYDFVFLTQRGSADFYDVEKMHPIFRELVARAHQRGIRVGLQLWPEERNIPDDALQGIVVEQERAVDASGHLAYTGVSHGVRQSATTGQQEAATAPGHAIFKARRSEILAAYAFQKAADGEYVPGSVVEITHRLKRTGGDAESVSMTLDAPDLAGKSVYVMTVHYHQSPDLFSSFLPNSFAGLLKAYADVHFDGAALDEFRYMAVDNRPGAVFRGRMYTANMAAYFNRTTGENLIRTLFDMRYSSAGNPASRVRAINLYFETLRQGPLNVEKSFASATSEILGSQTFHGIHDTFHNALDNDEIWATGINWWAIPRDYGQTDESTPFTTRLGIGMACPKPVEYNQYYTKDLRRFLEEGIVDARYNIRVHYHALNDQHGWGLDLGDPQLQKGIAMVEDKVRLLNHFDAPRPKMNVLYLFGYPSLANWFQPEGKRSRWDINDALQAEPKAVEAWNAGYRGPLVPSYLIDEGKIRVDDRGGLLLGGERFDAVVFFGPQYSKKGTLRLLEKFVAGGGRLLLDGVATRDFEGRPLDDRFAEIAARAVATSFSVQAMEKLGVPKLALDDGAVYTDGSVVLTDLDSLLGNKAKPFSLTLEGHRYTGAYIGLLALQIGKDGKVQKLAAGGLKELDRDGKPVVRLSEPADFTLRRELDGRAVVTVVGDASIAID